MKVSIRFGILSLFSSLLILIGALIICMNYFSTDKIFVDFFVKLISISSKNIERNVKTFFQPIQDDLVFGGKLIQKNVITTQEDDKFVAFLLETLKNKEYFSGVHWIDANSGNFIYLEKNDDGSFDEEKKVCDETCSAYSDKIDENGNYIGKSPEHFESFDPRNRVWYKKALATKQYYLSDLYLFYYRPGLGVTAVLPVYDAANKLKGTLGIDLRVNVLSDFVSTWKTTPHLFTFIFSDNGNLIAAKSMQNINQTSFVKVSDIHEPWINESYLQYKKNKQSLFAYEFKGKKYLAMYTDLKSTLGKPWTIALVLPFADIFGQINFILLASIFIAFVVLVVGMAFTWIISGAMSQPITKLANEAIAIKSLDFSKVNKMKSSIKEILFMRDAFNSMKQSLQSFIRYVPFSLVKNLMLTGGIAHVGGESKEITALFVDIEGFTSLSETMKPQELMSYLSDYLEAMSKVILQYNGTIDKYIGDAVMAFWGAPLENTLHAFHACQSSLAMLRSLADLNEHFGIAGKPKISVRIGINTGNAVVGNVGSEEKLSYTAIGDTINVGSRLQDLNKSYKTKILVTESTYQAVKEYFSFRLLDYVAVRGKKEGIYVYELLNPLHFLIDVLDVYNAEFKIAFYFYQHGKWDEAIYEFERMAGKYSEDNLINIYLDRCNSLKQTPQENWQGVWRVGQ